MLTDTVNTDDRTGQCRVCPEDDKITKNDPSIYVDGNFIPEEMNDRK